MNLAFDQSTSRFTLVRFQAGGRAFAVAVDQVRGLAARTNPDQGQAVTIAVETILGLAHPDTQPPSERRTLWLLRSGQPVAVEVSEPVRLIEVAVGHLFAVPPLIAARTTLKGACALFFEADSTEPVVLVDFLAATGLVAVSLTHSGSTGNGTD